MALEQRPWLNGKQAVISLTFDDGCQSQLTHALPVMDRHNLRGSFYLNPFDGAYKDHLARFKPAAGNGHEIGNHTCRHRCTLAMGMGDHPEGLEHQTLESVEADILLAEERLREVFPKHGPRTFCYPCYNQHVGHGAGRKTYTTLIAQHFVAGRGGTCNKGFLISPAYCDLSLSGGPAVERMWGFEMVGLAERAATQNKWLILVLHNVDGGYLSVQGDDFEELCT
ncbi:MAG TPA: polysaccharide deacetylase family protein, partial [Tepidisphaeraceae bacterium]